ncbi:MAG: glycoside hydrolase family 16 protein [Spirochaetes bacterium]|nr:glycoside hydrolase family 16 protein [Spirochaetota bacterium]
MARTLPLLVLLCSAPAVSLPPPAIRGLDYRLVFADEFEGPAGGSFDTNAWSSWAPGPRRDAVNQADAAALDGNGNLAITTRREGDCYVTGGVSSAGRKGFIRGYFECRARPQTQPGHWSAFWMMPHRMDKALPPQTGGVELDIFEYLRNGKLDRVANHTLHWGGYGSGHQSTNVHTVVAGIDSGWHTFAMLWTREGYRFFVDEQETGRLEGPVSEVRSHLIFSLEVGKWGGDIATAALPDSFLIDWVRVWQSPQDQAF